MSLEHVVTIGYEGADFSDFLATLETLGVDTLLDVREIAMSRRKGFAKTALRTGLTSVGIDYRHEPRLGSPKTMRHQLRGDGNYPRFFRDFERYLATQHALLESLVDELSGTVALLCYERDHTTCHRNVVANALRTLTGIVPKHHGVHPHGRRQAIAHSRTYLGESLSPA